MAVQAQYQSSTYTFSPDFRNRTHTVNLMVEELHKLQHNRNIVADVYGGVLNVANNINNCNAVNATTVFSSGPQGSELTCNASASRKRARDDPPMALPTQMDGQLHHPQSFPAFSSQSFRYPSLATGAVSLGGPAAEATFSVAGQGQGQGQGQGLLNSRLLESSDTSTSGRPPAAWPSPFSLLVSPVAQDIVSHLYQQNLEVDALIRLQNKRLRSGLDEARKRHCRALLSALDQQMVKQLREKETELENASRRNAELEEKIRQMTAENQIWFNVAKNNEAMVSSLRTSLEQVLDNVVANGVVGSPDGGAEDLKEGFGDTDDARSFCFDGAVAVDDAGERDESQQWRKSCKVCGERDVSILLLPCRHLCLCRACESNVDTCPICRSPSNASVRIFMS